MSSNGINLNRFSGLTRQYLAGQALFAQPTVSWGQGGTGGVQWNNSNSNFSASSSFQLASNAFTPGYGVNTSDSGGTERYDGNLGLSWNGNGFTTINRATASNGTPELLGFAGTGITTGTVPTTPPEIPSAYANYAALDGNISESQLSTLLSLDEFQLARLGLKVVTDGAGAIDFVTLDTSSVGLLGNAAAAKSIALDKLDFSFGFGSDGRGNTLASPINRSAIINDLIQGPRGLSTSGLNKTPLNGEAKTGLNPLNEERLAAVLQRAQAPTIDATLTGPQASVGPEQAANIALAKSGTGLSFSNEFNQQLGQMKDAAARMAGLFQMQKMMLPERLGIGPGLTPLVPQRGTGSASQQSHDLQLQLALDGGGSGGGLGFAQARLATGMTFGGGEQGNGNPSSGGGHQRGESSSEQKKRRPLQLIA
ncbi:MAG: hypothetical protein QE263_08795 [Vampirovibrionales bacterium]|nr:hypothetical protein [Vampirovibrionales bacterium]